MGVQQNKKSKARTRNRRAQWLKIDGPGMSVCPQCKSLKMPHRVCPECGFYKNKEVVAAE
ncbi:MULTISPECIES: 50S ribosomal protein L32 [Carboxydocella]|uniref:Large ribosomal subunit protein bL32 n=2 Tax=Carboxydocella TaxID=178898 RepID=A0A1T4N7S2_9FIRM|nr:MULTISPECIES: 50S ribosomal protein L32 [Carboxydocella]AVX20937.1 LSU ribosomal protein L32P [Carboxydocella thermautotrophica]AVX31351.1 LSU ribosomal protein L32P [Carboxydocella thermautotrophica]SJZ75223.1 LSU ribosomal protein L32P [Carboxydocella sporoproducens DSM 16521]GAW29900.1 50S ribosomal protein L32 [Carboxydocella sp. ULO1]GAW30498.1 50S ribosomal protein L32 [Carboxydocella sp. JDF658]